MHIPIIINILIIIHIFITLILVLMEPLMRIIVNRKGRRLISSMATWTCPPLMEWSRSIDTTTRYDSTRPPNLLDTLLVLLVTIVWSSIPINNRCNSNHRASRACSRSAKSLDPCSSTRRTNQPFLYRQ